MGASARAAVHSLTRAGHSAWAIDLFTDRDLVRVASCARCPMERYPEALPRFATRFEPGPLLYTGGLENYPHVVRELGARRELWGNPPETLDRVRDPFSFFPALSPGGFRVPRLIPRGESCPTVGCWLRKPFRSAAGLGIRVAHPGEAASAHHYFQEFVGGAPMSALFVNTTLFGMTEQLIGEAWLHAKPFAYCGNIGLTTADAAVCAMEHQLCEHNILRGVWGVDYVLNDGVAYLIEVNPRYTSAAEVLEHATGNAVFGAYGGSQPGSLLADHRAEMRPVGKAIYYAPRAIRFPPGGPWDADLAGDFDAWRLPDFADIPDAGSVIEPGCPVLTLFATGRTPKEVRERLQSRAAELDSLFWNAQP